MNNQSVTVKKAEFERKHRPKVTVKKIIANNWAMIKLVFKASPLGVSMYAIESIRNSILVFFEHTWLVSYILECVEYHRPFSQALWAVLLILGLIIGTGWTGSLMWQRMYDKTRLKAQTALKNMVFDKAHEVDLEQFDNPEYYNDFVMNVGKTGDIVNNAFWTIRVICESTASVVTTGIFFLSKSYIAFLTVLAATIINVIFSFMRNNWFYSKFKTAAPHYRKTDYTKRLFYLFDYAKEVRLNPDIKEHAFKSYDKCFDGLVDVLKYHDKHIVSLGVISDYFITIMLEIVTVLVLVYQASVLQVISYSMVIVIFNSMYTLLSQFNRMVQKLASSAENCMYIDKIFDFLKTEPKIVSRKNLPITPHKCDISLKNVSFRYNDTDGDVLHNISLNVKKGEKIALVGYNGAGKTTLIKLIMRLYDVSDGEILLDNRNIKDYDVAQYRKNIGVIFQDFNIYAMSVKDNVVMGISDNSVNDRVCKSLENSGFSERLATMDNGIDTMLTKEFDDNGINLSGGESQKIAIARSFFRNAGLIILDEPSSALDPIAEYKFNKYLLEAAKDCTVIFISHRLSTTRISDKIYMLEQGRIVEEGTHDELLNMGGKYSQMWHAQADKYKI